MPSKTPKGMKKTSGAANSKPLASTKPLSTGQLRDMAGGPPHVKEALKNFQQKKVKPE